MGSSTVSIQSVTDVMATTGSIDVRQAAGGYSSLTWLAIANDVLNDLVSQKFNWKWNSFRVPTFPTISYQCDYATVAQKGIGWLENADWTDINNTSLPKPRWTIDAIRQLQPTSFAGSPPTKICVMQNSVLEQGVWPGAGSLYVNPIGITTNATPQNPRTNILDATGNILILTTYGTTGATAPDGGKNAVVGTVIPDNTCNWTVADPSAQGFRLYPMPPATGVVYQVAPIAQSSLTLYTKLSQMIDPIPDDYAGSFRAGVYAYCYKYATDPNVRREFLPMRQAWLQETLEAVKQGDREAEDAGFVVSRNVMGTDYSGDVGPANPYGTGWPGWGR